MASNKSLKPHLDEILKILKQKYEPRGKFYYENQIAASEFEVEVESVGKLNFPLTDEVIQALKSISSEAKFGLKDQTLLDKRVRDTCEIKPDKFVVKFNPEYFEHLLSEISHGLGLVDVKLEAHLHNLLIYGPGQFFKKHQDTEKLQGMIGTLIIILPSPHLGGDLILAHSYQSFIFKSENKNSTTVKCVAFYCDCNHEVTKVTEGYRVALVYNLVMTSKQTVNLICLDLEKLKSVIKAYFSLSNDIGKEQTCSYGDGVPKLAYYLDHEYTEWSLKWHALKGNDQRNATALHDVALELNLIPHLALVQVNQTVQEDYDFIISHTAKFNFWVDQFNKRLSFKPFEIDREFTCMTKENKEFDPYDQSTEYTGNAGANESCWYRRAAVVLWEKSRDLLMSFTYDNANAFQNFLSLMDLPEKEEEVLEIIETVGKKLYHVTPDQKRDFKPCVAFALRINCKDMAFKLLSHFNLELLESDISEELAKLQNKYGFAFITNLLPQWQKGSILWPKGPALSNVLFVVTQLFLHGIDKTFVHALLEQECNEIVKQDYRYSYYYEFPMREVIEKNLNNVRQMLQANVLLQNEAIDSKLREHIISQPELYPLTDLLDMLFSVTEIETTFLSYKPLQEYLIAKINEILSIYSGSDSKNNWSILKELPCNCRHCSEVKTFLRSKTETEKVISVVMKIRNHIVHKLEKRNLPVDIHVDPSCRPYKLIIQKQQEVFTDSLEEFDKLNYFLCKIKKL